MYSIDEGAYLIDCDVDAHHGLGQAWWGPLDRAKQFTSMLEATEFWKRQSTVQPLRHDGRPNRPLTAHTVEMVMIEVAVH